MYKRNLLLRLNQIFGKDIKTTEINLTVIENDTDSYIESYMLI